MRRKNNSSSILFLIIFGGIIAGAIYLYNSVMFERNAPVVTITKNLYWNLKEAIDITIEDDSGIKWYEVKMISSEGEKILAQEPLLVAKTKLELKIEYPKMSYGIKDKEVKIVVNAVDVSKWDFFAGNTVSLEKSFIIDKKKPLVSLISNSYGIYKGGTALVIFKAKDENLDDLYIEVNKKQRFKVQPFYKEGYYASLVAWPVRDKKFDARIIVKDKAGNTMRVHIPYYHKAKSYRKSRINLSNRFLKGKIAELAYDYPETQGIEDSIEQFKIINEEVRASNEKVIHEMTSKVSDEMISNFSIKPFYPLKNAAKVASFGDHRLYYYKKKKVSESYHLGLDLASVKMGAIRTQNYGMTVFAEENGIYGNLPIIHHGMGLYTIYGHCSSLRVNTGESVKPNQQVGNTGKSGYAMGDHLHFGVLVQGIEVRPEEWMDKDWIRLNITEVMKNAKKLIGRS
ncbi:M23 family metallopeptidase [Sulfurimonas sp. MAG313]|nr:M23 family metallopeptidase [Sulfurimonas sp. MAG313]MDF1880980.1 M23 family metallopeptidase [Sulfurimonas sp. MAG313]